MFGHPLVHECQIDEETGEVIPVVTIVTDNGGPFRSMNFRTAVPRRDR
jgi:putative transposase